MSNFDIWTPSPLFNVVTMWKCPQSVLQHWKEGEGGWLSTKNMFYEISAGSSTPIESVCFVKMCQHFCPWLWLFLLHVREIFNFWNVYCFTTNQMQDETPKENCQTAALISHDSMWNNELAFCSTRVTVFKYWNFSFAILALVSPKNKYEWHFTEMRCYFKKTESIDQTAHMRVRKNEPITSHDVHMCLPVGCDWWFLIRIFCNWETFTYDANLYHCKFSQFTLTYRSVW